MCNFENADMDACRIGRPPGFATRRRSGTSQWLPNENLARQIQCKRANLCDFSRSFVSECFHGDSTRIRRSTHPHRSPPKEGGTQAHPTKALRKRRRERCIPKFHDRPQVSIAAHKCLAVKASFQNPTPPGHLTPSRHANARGFQIHSLCNHSTVRRPSYSGCNDDGNLAACISAQSAAIWFAAGQSKS